MKNIKLLLLAFMMFLPSCKNIDATDPGESDPGYITTSVFEEVNEKMDTMSKVLGDICSSETGSVGSKKLSRFKEEPIFFMYDQHNVGSFINIQQQLDYIITIINFIQEHLVNSDYGVQLEKGTIYEGRAYMKTIDILNNLLIEYNLETPMLRVKFDQEDKDIIVKTSWDYRSSFMEEHAPLWSLDILSSLRFVIGDNDEIKQIWVNYFFNDSIQFNSAVGLFDFENSVYQSVNFDNQTNIGASYEGNEKERILQNAELFNSGNMTHENLFRCNHMSVSRTRIGENIKSEEFEQCYYFDNSSPIIEDMSGYNDYTPNVPEDVNAFNSLYDEVYSVLKEFKFETSFDRSGKSIDVTDLYVDAATYAFWKSMFVFNNSTEETMLPFLDYEEAISVFTTVSNNLEDASLKQRVLSLVSYIQSRENKYAGNDFKVGDDLYEIALDKNAQKIWPESYCVIANYCDSDYGYLLKINGEVVLGFSRTGEVHL